MARGDIYYTEIPYPKGQPGREQAGRRPALMVQTDANDGQRLPTTMIVPLTTNLQALRYPFTFQIDPSPQNGLTSASVVLVFQLRAIDRQRVSLRKVGTLEERYLERLDNLLRELLDLW